MSNQIFKKGYNIIDTIDLDSLKYPMLVCGNSFKKTKAYQKFQGKVLEFSSYSPNPKYEDICNGVDLFRNNSCQSIIAVGGGSAIDVAKCIKLFSSMDDGVNYLEQKGKENDIPLIAVPTTYGTGSESTAVAVIYYKGEKVSVVDDSILPSIVFLDHLLVESLPLYQKKCTMLDALCQSIESLWSVSSTKESQEYSKESISLILQNMEGALLNEKDANKNILYAANLSGRAIYITKTTVPHSMSYKLTTLFNISHGHSVAVSLLGVWSLILEGLNSYDEKIFNEPISLVESKLASLNRLFHESEGKLALMKYRKILLDFNLLPIKPIREVSEEVLDVLASSVNLNRMKNNPINISYEQLKQLYIEILYYK